uniref:Putative secreted protein n=1 Tax=Ixodes ricinus TaxID=34613 RepID=A0A6B0U0Y5_IXORI
MLLLHLVLSFTPQMRAYAFVYPRPRPMTVPACLPHHCTFSMLPFVWRAPSCVLMCQRPIWNTCSLYSQQNGGAHKVIARVPIPYLMALY